MALFGLSKTKEALFGGISKLFGGKSSVDSETLDANLVVIEAFAEGGEVHFAVPIGVVILLQFLLFSGRRADNIVS